MLERVTLAQTVGGILHAIEKRVQHLNPREDRPMAIPSHQMMKDLAAMNEAVSQTADLLDGAARKQFREASAPYLETLASRIDLQRAQERGVETLTRTEVEKIAGVNADQLMERAQQLRAKELRETMSAQRLAGQAADTTRRQEARNGIDPQSQREPPVDRAAAASSRQSAARETRDATAAIEAARLFAERPAQPIPQALVQSDALASLRAEQEKLVNQFEVERLKGQSLQGQRLKHGE